MSLPSHLSGKIRAIETSFADGELHNMLRASSLESRLSEIAESEDLTAPSKLFVSDRLEDVLHIESRDIPHVQPSASRFRYFLDATQKTWQVYRIGLTPVLLSVAVAGVLERDPDGTPRLLSNTLECRTTWLIPETEQPGLQELRTFLIDHGESVRNPMDLARGDEAVKGEFRSAVQLAFRAAGTVRSELEAEVFAAWQHNAARLYPDCWIAIDGRLNQPHPQAIGLVKRLNQQHLMGEEALTLFGLAAGKRTTGFQLTPRTGSQLPDSARTHWYQRFWNSDGLDIDHALARIEAPNSIATSEQIDEIASWLHAERLPRATADPRWPTLLYPIHILERMLKRKLAELTSGWPE